MTERVRTHHYGGAGDLPDISDDKYWTEADPREERARNEERLGNAAMSNGLVLQAQAHYRRAGVIRSTVRDD